jgi:predicted DNA binding CopG/RHH family protein
MTSVGSRIAMYYCWMMPRQRNRTRYTAGEIGRIRVIEDFLAARAELVPREENVKVTLSLSRRSLDFFKREAKKRRVPYQRMIRALVDTYAERQVAGKAR